MWHIVVILLAAGLTGVSYGSPAYVDDIRFVQYVDEGTALEEVRAGNLDIYYSRIPTERLDSMQARQGLKVYDSTGGSYSILVNPAVSGDAFNPFSIRDVRFALNYIIDRKLVVNELMGGSGTVMISNYGPADPDYLGIVDLLESFDFRYNPALAGSMINDALVGAGAEKIDGIWHHSGEPVSINIFVRSDDPVRSSIGQILSASLEEMGFEVNRVTGDLNKAFVVVYGSDPAELQWHLYTEGWAGRSAFVRYDQVGLAQMYAPWFSTMPGFNDVSYWNYKHDELDDITQKIYTGQYQSEQDRDQLIRNATVLGVTEAVRVFIAANVDKYVVNQEISGAVNDFGAGLPGRFTTINARGPDDSLNIGVKQIYQGAWNPVMGLTDKYSNQIWYTLFDPGLFRHPYTGEIFGIRADWSVQTAGPDGTIEVPPDAVLWNTADQRWNGVGSGVETTSRVTYDLAFSDWHHGIGMDMSDVLYPLYFAMEWGSEQTDGDRTFDSEFTPRSQQTVKTISGIRVLDEDTIEVYVDYWHFDPAEIAAWAEPWASVPWEIHMAMEQSVMDGRMSFSRSGSVSKGVSWLSLIVPADSGILREYLDSFARDGAVPAALAGRADDSYYVSRYEAASGWIEQRNHAVISNGPFYLDYYSPESRTISTSAFDDESYPYSAGDWSHLEEIRLARLQSVDIPEYVLRGQDLSIPVTVSDATVLYHFVTDGSGNAVSSGVSEVSGDSVTISLDGAQTELLSTGANTLKVFAVSDILRPDIYSTSFLAVDRQLDVPDLVSTGTSDGSEAPPYWLVLPAVLAAAIVCGIYLILRRRQRASQARAST